MIDDITTPGYREVKQIRDYLNGGVPMGLLHNEREAPAQLTEAREVIRGVLAGGASVDRDAYELAGAVVDELIAPQKRRVVCVVTGGVLDRVSANFDVDGIELVVVDWDSLEGAAEPCVVDCIDTLVRTHDRVLL